LVVLAGLGEPALCLVILACRGAVPLALVALFRTVRLLGFGHPDLRRFYHVLMRTGRRSPPLRTVAEIDRCWGAELARDFNPAIKEDAIFAGRARQDQGEETMAQPQIRFEDGAAYERMM